MIGRVMPLQVNLLLTKAWALHCRFDASFYSFFAAFFSFGVFVAAFLCVFLRLVIYSSHAPHRLAVFNNS